MVKAMLVQHGLLDAVSHFPGFSGQAEGVPDQHELFVTDLRAEVGWNQGTGCQCLVGVCVHRENPFCH